MQKRPKLEHLALNPNCGEGLSTDSDKHLDVDLVDDTPASIVYLPVM